MAGDTTVNRNLGALLEISRTINASHLDLGEVLASVLSVAADALQVEASSIALIDDDTGEIVFHLAQGEKADAMKTIRLNPGEGIVGAVIESGEPTIVNDVDNDPRFMKAADDKSGFKTRSILCVPMRTTKKLWGAVEVMNKTRKGGFTPDDLELCSAIASQAAIALENATLHGEIVKTERLAAIGGAIAGMAHCIKNVLNGIQGGAYMVDSGLEKEKPESLKRGWQIVKKNNTFMQELVLDMLAYSREREPEYEPCDANELLQGVCDMIASKAAERGVAIGYSPGNMPGLAEIDPKGIRRCMLNLVSNAVDACSDNNGQVIVSSFCTDSDPALLRIEISDNGCGISEENRKQLFKMFFSTKGNKGTGLGLAVTHKIIAEHGGAITVTSKEGSGTTFTVDLPFKHKLASD